MTLKVVLLLFSVLLVVQALRFPQAISNEKYFLNSQLATKSPFLPLSFSAPITKSISIPFRQHDPRGRGSGASLHLTSDNNLYFLFWFENGTPTTKHPAVVTSLNALLGITLPSNQSSALSTIPGDQQENVVSFVLATDNGYFECQNVNISSVFFKRDLGKPCNFITVPGMSQVNAIQMTVSHSQMGMWIGTSKGLLFIDLQAQKPKYLSPAAINLPILSLAWHEGLQVLVAGVPNGIWLYFAETNTWRVEYTPAPIDDIPTSIAFVSHGEKDDVALWVGTQTAVNIIHLSNYSIDRIGAITDYMKSDFYGILPFNNITAIEFVPESKDVILGTSKGIVRYEFATRRWKYYYGDRWLAGSLVSSVLVHPFAVDDQCTTSYSILVSTETGISRISIDCSWTFDAKAEYFASSISYSRHDRFGLVGDCSLRTYGDLTTYLLTDHDNDGLWTALYTASLVYKYQVTQDEKTRSLILHHFEAIVKLNQIAGVNGFMARSFSKFGDKTHDPVWANSTVFPGWIYKRDTSSDEVSGHIYIMTLIANAFENDSNDELKAASHQAKQLIIHIVDYILENDYYLIDPVTGKPTKWGYWGPSELNDNPVRYGERYLNSLEILSYLYSAYKVSNQNPKYQAAIQQLLRQHQYGLNLRNIKYLKNEESNFSDDELAYSCYLTFLITWKAFGKPTIIDLEQQVLEGLKNHWNKVKPFKVPMWNLVTLFYHPSAAQSAKEREQRIQESIQGLQDLPLDLIAWPTFNSHRTDILRTNDRSKGSVVSVTSLPLDEVLYARYNGNPNGLDKGSGYDEDEPTVYLLAYWFAKVTGMVK